MGKNINHTALSLTIGNPKEMWEMIETFSIATEKLKAASNAIANTPYSRVEICIVGGVSKISIYNEDDAVETDKQIQHFPGQ